MSTGRRKLLVADDSPTVQKVIRLTFEDEGVEVVAAGNGAEALRILQDGPPPDVLLADVMMPGPDGYALCERVKRDPRLQHVPVVLLVGKFEPFNEAEARRVGADTVLTKPFQSIRDLVSKVGSLIGGESKESERGAEQAERGSRVAHHAEAERQEHRRPDEPASSAREEVFETAPDVAPSRGVGPTRYNVEPPMQEAEDDLTTGTGGVAPEPAPEAYQLDPNSSFADLGIDDEMIESRPAEAFGARTPSAPQAEAASAEHTASPIEDTAAEAGQGAPAFEVRTWQEPSGFESQPLPASAAHSRAAAPEAAIGASQAETVAREPQQAFAARAAAAATADDALLDLGGFGASEPAAVHVTEADDFILDLDDEPALSAAPQSFGATASSADAITSPQDSPAAFGGQDLTFDFDSDEAQRFAPTDEAAPSPLSFDAATSPAPFDAPADVDEAGAFAEAAHGEPIAAADVFDFDSASPAEAERSAPQAELGAHDSAVAREVVAQDVPPRFDSFELRDDPLDFSDSAQPEPERFAPQASQPESAAARGFIEPAVVPAEEPAPMSLADEFTDGSVEGDRPKLPVEAESSHVVEAAGAAETVEPTSPSAANSIVGQSRAGFDERLSAGRLSAEEIDAIARRVVELMSDQVIREIAWEVVPDLAELHVRRKLEEERGR